MIFCEKCFSDMEIRAVIRGLGQLGNCPFCNSINSFIYNTEENTALVEYFDELLNIYTPAALLPPDFPKEELNLLKNELVYNWSIFNLDPQNVYRIITNICCDKYRETKDLFDLPVGIAEMYDIEYLKIHSLLTTNRWEDFVNAVKTQNRFHTKYINTEILERYCSYIRKAYKRGDIFYRGRVSPKEGYPREKMGAPPHELATAGRANASGIRCLYLANSMETTIHEVRAGAFDYICVGKFELQQDIIVVDLKSIDKISPFIEGLDCKQHAINKEHLKKINAEMGKVLRRSDSALDYVPTQYISDFIKSIEHDGEHEYMGIEYNSTMSNSGFNLAIFDPDLFTCIDVEVYKIANLRYETQKI